MIESVQTPVGITRALERANFVNISTAVERDGKKNHFAALAFK
jgi:hypothetical protein